MKIINFYFSGTGNTWWIVNKSAEIFKEHGAEIKNYSIESEKLNSDEVIVNLIKNSDLIGFSYPIYGSTMPENMKGFLKRLIQIFNTPEFESKETKECFVLTSMMLFSGDGALVAKKQLKTINFLLKYAKNLKMCSNISIPGFKANPLPLDKLEKKKIKAEQQLKKFIKKIMTGKKTLEGRFNPIGRFFGWIQRKLMHPIIKKYTPFKIDHDRCILCKICVNNCPTDNFAIEDEEIKVGNDCIFCLRCYNYCPTYAVMVGGKYCDPKKYKRFRGPVENYNTKKIS